MSGACKQDCNAGHGLVCVHGVPYCVLECVVIVRYKMAMYIVRVILEHFWHCCAIFSLSQGTVKERCTAEWVQSTLCYLSIWTSLVLFECFCTLPLIFPLTYFFLRRFFGERFFMWVHWPCSYPK